MWTLSHPIRFIVGVKVMHNRTIRRGWGGRRGRQGMTQNADEPRADKPPTSPEARGALIRI